MAFCSSAEVKTYLKTSSSAFDSAIAQLIPEVDADIERRTGIPTHASALPTQTDVVDSCGGHEIRVKKHPIDSITSVSYRQSDFTFLQQTNESEANMETDWNRIFTQYVVAGAGRRNLQVVYKAGYLTADVPEDLKLCAILMVVQLLHQRNLIGYDNQNVLNLNITLSKEDHAYIRRTLLQYTPPDVF